MINFGAPNPTIEKTRKIRHLCARKFVPVFERLTETYVRPSSVYAKDGGLQMLPRYERWGGYWWSITPTSKPQTAWTLARIKRARTGQLKFL